MSESTYTIHPGGERGYRTTSWGTRIEARRRTGDSDYETADEFARRLAYGTVKELIVHFIEHLRLRRVPEGTIDTYRSNFNAHIIDGIGDKWLTDCTHDLYVTYLTGIADTHGGNRFLAIARTLGALARYGLAAGHWPAGVQPFGGFDARIAWDRDMRRALGLETENSDLITLEDCPSETDVADYSEFLREAFRVEYGERAEILGHMPLVGLYTGTRIASTFALHDKSFKIARRFVTVRSQVNRRTPWTPAPKTTAGLADWKPPLIPEKQGRPKGYHAQLWGYAADDYLAGLLERARADYGGWLFAAALESKRPLDRYEQFERECRKTYGKYQWTHHWARHTYASTNLAPRDPGPGARAGYGRTVHEVARYLGDRVKTVEQTYWHPPSSDHGTWSDQPPGS